MSLSKTGRAKWQIVHWARIFRIKAIKRGKSQQTKEYRLSIIIKILENDIRLQKRRNKFRGKKMSAPKCYGGDSN